MSLKIDRMQLEIIINNDQARKSLRALDDEMRELKKSLRKVPEGSDEWNKINNRLKVIKQEHDKIIESLGLEKLSIKELGQRQRELNAIMRNMDPSTKAYRDLEKQMRAIKARQGELRVQTQKTNLSLNKMANSFNKYFGFVTAGIASFSGLLLAGKKAITMFAEFDDKVSDVMKTTGQTREQVYAINEELKKIDTRTAQEDLLDLAYVAGKLGITAREDIEGFVRATNQISVALKTDLGGNTEEAVRQLGKLVDLFKVKDEFGIEAGLLKVGSAINDLGMASTANEGYLVEFAKRVAGIAPSAGVSIENVLGLGATLDQLGQTSEVSSTVYTMVMTGMVKKTNEFAKIAKMDITAFNELLKTDTNEAFIRVLEGLNGNNAGMQELVENLGEVGLEGRRSTAVLGVLANNTKILREQQDLATAAFDKGTSITDEYNIKNESAQAILEKKRKVLNNLAIDLGEKLIPVLTVSTSAFSYFVRAMIAIIDFTAKYSRIIIPLITSITAYGIAVKVAANWDRIHAGFIAAKNVVQKAAALATSVLTGKVKIATIAQQAWNTAQKANPIGLIVGLLVAAGTALYMYSKGLSAAEKLQRSLNDINIEAKKSIAAQKVEVEGLLRVARSVISSDERRLAAIKRLNEISPEYLGNINLENINTEAAIKAKEKYIDALLKEARIKAAQEKLIEVEKKLIDLRMDSSATELSWHQQMWNHIKAGGNQSIAAAYGIQTQIENFANENETLIAQQNSLLNIIDQGNASIIETVVKGETEAAEVIKEKWGETFDQHKEYLRQREDMMRVLDSTKYVSDGDQMTNNEAWNQNVRPDAEPEIEEKTGLEGLMALMELQKQKLDEQRAEGKISQEEYNLEMEGMEFAHLTTLIDLRKKLGMDTLDLEKKLNQMRINNQIATEQELIDKQQKMVERFMEFTKIGSSAIEDFMAGNEDALLEGGKNMINFALDLLKQQMQIAIAGATMQSLAQPDSIATFGISGLARAAVLVTLIEGAFAVVKGAVSRIGSGNKADAYADGNYQDITTKSGSKYRAKVVSQNHPSGLYDKPTYVPGFGLFGETPKPELVFNPADTATIMNTPGLVNAIQATLGNGVQQFANGNAREIIRESSTTTNNTLDPNAVKVLSELTEVLKSGITGKWIYQDFKIMQQKEEAAINKTA